MIVKVRELDSFMDRMSNRSCFSDISVFNFVNFFKIVLHLPLHATGSFPIASSVHHCISRQGSLLWTP